MWMTRATYAYALVDWIASRHYLKKRYGDNSHLLRSMTPKHALIVAFRIAAVYEIVSYLSVQHLTSRAKPILARQGSDPRRQKLLKEID